MEVLWLAERCGRQVLGFLDDTPEKQGTTLLGVPILGGISSWVLYDDCDFVIAIGSPKGRSLVASKMNQLGRPEFARLIDPSAIVGKEVSIQDGSIVCAGVICTVKVYIGLHAVVNLNTTIGHESSLGDFCTIAPNASISGNVVCGDMVEIGTGAKIREKISIGSGSVVGMGSVLTKNVEPCKVVVGNPARVIRSIE